MSTETEDLFVQLFFILLMGTMLGLIPATIAQRKGYSFGTWWFFGFMLFIVAIVAACCLEDKTKPKTPTYYLPVQPYTPPYPPSTAPSKTDRSAIDELKEYKELLDQGTITEEEFASVKARLLNKN